VWAMREGTFQNIGSFQNKSSSVFSFLEKDLLSGLLHSWHELLGVVSALACFRGLAEAIHLLGSHFYYVQTRP